MEMEEDQVTQQINKLWGEFMTKNNTLLVTHQKLEKVQFLKQLLTQTPMFALIGYRFGLASNLPQEQVSEHVQWTGDVETFKARLFISLPNYVKHNTPILVVIDTPKLMEFCQQMDGLVELMILQQHPHVHLLVMIEELDFPNRHYFEFFDQTVVDTSLPLQDTPHLFPNPTLRNIFIEKYHRLLGFQLGNSTRCWCFETIDPHFPIRKELLVTDDDGVLKQIRGGKNIYIEL